MFQQSFLCPLMFDSEPHEVTEKATERNRMCVGDSVCVVLDKSWSNGSVSGPLIALRQELCLKLPLPSNTHSNNLKLSFLIETFHSLPCKHPAWPAGAHTITTSTLPQNKSPQQCSHMHRVPTPALMLCVACSLQALKNQTARRQLRRTC